MLSTIEPRDSFLQIGYTPKRMKITFYAEGEQGIQFVGDKRALQMLTNGLNQLGVKAYLTYDLNRVAEADFAFLSNIICNLSPRYHVLKMLNKPYGLINFHEDFIKYWGPCAAFYSAILHCLKEEKFPFILEHIRKVPDHLLFFSPPPRKETLKNYEVIKDASLCIANSPSEAKTVLRDCPSANVQSIFWGPGMLTDANYPYSDKFLKVSGLSKKSYVLQVGRLAPNKNQLGTILATKDLDIPLVFISNYAFFDDYSQACIDAILKWRKAPTLIFSSTLKPLEEKNLKIVKVPSQFDLGTDLLVSAYQNAGLYLHPAFTELPGFVYLEAAKLGTPTVATEWTTLRDYFIDKESGCYTLDERIHYLKKPYDIQEIEQSIELMFGKEFAPSDHPILHRNERSMAEELLAHIRAIPS